MTIKFDNFSIEDIKQAKLIEKEYNRTTKRKWYKKRGNKFLHLNRDSLTKYRKKIIALKSRYGIDQNDYEGLLIDQNFCCAICGIKEKDTNKGLYLDHDHETDEIRGLLCNPCNLAIGLIKHNIENSKKMTQYLEKYER